MKYLPGSHNSNVRLVGMLLSPSWLSGIMTMLVSLTICFGTILIIRYEASSIRVDFLNYQAGQIARTYDNVNNSLSDNSYLANVPLLIFWGLVGVVVYLTAINIFTAIHDTAEINSELHYVHADRRELLWRPIKRLAFRLAVLAVWLFYALFFIHHILPYCVAAAVVASAQSQLAESGLYALLGVAVMAVAIHVHVLLLRLFLIRPRLFSDTLYADVERTSDL